MEEELIENAKEFISSGNDNLDKGRYNAAVSDYFKAIVILCDFLIYRKRRVLPKNHTERFEILRSQFEKIYFIVSKLFKKYVESYNLRMKKEEAVLMKENVAKIKELVESY